MVKLPNGDRAIIDPRKLRVYCLNPDHPKGGHKARVFAAALGFRLADADRLEELLHTAATEGDAQAAGSRGYGARFVVDFMVDGPGGSAMVRSVWEVRPADDLPHLVTCYVR
jgi:hypothetical protein